MHKNDANVGENNINSDITLSLWGSKYYTNGRCPAYFSSNCAQFFIAADENPPEQALVLYQVKLDGLVKNPTSGDIRAQHKTGVLLQTDEAPIQNHTAAIKWYLKAADHVYSRPQFKLGRMYAVSWGFGKITRVAMTGSV